MLVEAERDNEGVAESRFLGLGEVERLGECNAETGVGGAPFSGDGSSCCEAHA